MKPDLELKKGKRHFAVKHITDYYSYNAKYKYFDLIDSILDRFENNVIDYDELKTNDELENIIVEKLLSVFMDKLGDEKKNNPTGLFGVKRAFFTDGTNLYYKDLIKDEFVRADPIYAHNLKELKIKVKSDNGIWLVFDEKKYRNLSLDLKGVGRKSARKSSKGYSGSKKLGGFPRPSYSSSLADSVHNHYGRQ